ncbi:hypothetical protein MWS69_002645 [Citrobacter amalonaticus]|nr:hypothetical protein [Citrobacter amalonaticus]
MDESRKQFENIIRGKCWSVQKTDNGDYLHERVQLMWMSWRESRAAIEIKLPPKQELSPYEHYMPKFTMDADSVESAIRAAGIKVKE